MLHAVSNYLRKTCMKYPEHIALVDEREQVSYASFIDKAERVAFYLINASFFKQPIAVMMDRSAGAVITFLGVALSGNFYTVIDTKMPNSRIDKILDTFCPKLIITDKRNASKAEEIKITSKDIEIIYFEDIIANKISDENIHTIMSIESKIIDTDILYVLFISGSTGEPKGVTITHRSVIDYIEWASETFQLDHTTIFGNQAPFYFDNSVLDIYSTIRNGAAMHIIPQVLYAFPIRLLEYVRDQHINTVFWVPTVLSRVANLGILDKCDIDCLKKILFAGEVMPAKQLNMWRRRLPNAVFANLYGPTEITVDCTYYIVNRDISDTEPVPIGYPCMNSGILVLNDENQLVGINEQGELCVRGTGLSLGYYNNPEKTKEVFVQNPLNDLYEERIYRTGDIVHYNSRGEIIYDGRRDSQVKHTGHRIELGEIETAVSAIDKVLMSCCLHDVVSDRLVLFYTGDLEEGQIRKVLSDYLPEYMLPNKYVKLERMPLNMNGKIDRLKLKESICVEH